MSISTKFTYEDLQLIPPDRNRYEIVDGEISVTPAPIPLHQVIVGNIYGELREYSREHQSGVVLMAPCDIVFTSSTVLEPDVFFVSKARLHIIGEKNLSGPPDLVVEVSSESTGRWDREVKSKQYALYGVPEFWLVDAQEGTVETFRLQEREYQLAERLQWGGTLTSRLFPGLAIAVSSLWESM